MDDDEDRETERRLQAAFERATAGEIAAAQRAVDAARWFDLRFEARLREAARRDRVN